MGSALRSCGPPHQPRRGGAGSRTGRLLLSPRGPPPVIWMQGSNKRPGDRRDAGAPAEKRERREPEEGKERPRDSGGDAERRRSGSGRVRGRGERSASGRVMRATRPSGFATATESANAKSGASASASGLAQSAMSGKGVAARGASAGATSRVGGGILIARRTSGLKRPKARAPMGRAPRREGAAAVAGARAPF